MSLEGKLWKKVGLITRSDCMSVTDLNQTVRYICHVVDVCYKLHKDFHEYGLFNMSDQLVVGIVFSCFSLKNYKNLVLRYSMTIEQYSCVEVTHQITKNGLKAQQQSLHDCKTPQHVCESWQVNCVFRLYLALSTRIMEFEYKQAYKMIETGVLVWKSKNMKPYQPIFFYIGSNKLKAKWWAYVFYGFS